MVAYQPSMLIPRVERAEGCGFEPRVDLLFTHVTYFIVHARRDLADATLPFLVVSKKHIEICMLHSGLSVS